MEAGCCRRIAAPGAVAAIPFPKPPEFPTHYLLGCPPILAAVLIGMVYAYYMALRWFWVACPPSLFKVRGWTFDVRRSASGRNLKLRKAACRPPAVRLVYMTRPGGDWMCPREYQSYPRRVS